MKRLLLGLLALAILSPHTRAEDAAPVPTYPANFVGGPQFNTKAGEQSAGTASVIKLKDEPQAYILSVRHLLGPDGGFKEQTAAADVPAFVKSIKIRSFTGTSRSYTATGLLVPATELDTNGGPINDLAIYQLQDKAPQDQAVALADKLPEVGETVWVVARVRGGVPEGQIMQSAKVTVNKEGEWLKAQFDNDQIVTNGASGAPVLNAAGEVVGVYSGHLKKEGHVIAFIVPSTLITSVIKQPAVPAP